MGTVPSLILRILRTVGGTRLHFGGRFAHMSTLEFGSQSGAC